MLATMFPTLLVLASAAVAQAQAQEETTSVVTEISISPSPTTEEVFTIQTSTPSASDPWACFVDCLMPPCTTPASCLTGSVTSVPPVSDTVVSVITDPSLSTVTGIMSIPPLETPSPTGVATSAITVIPSGTRSGEQSSIIVITSVIPTGSPTSTTTSASSNSATPTSSGPAEQTTNAAVSMAKGEGVPFVVAIAGALALL